MQSDQQSQQLTQEEYLKIISEASDKYNADLEKCNAYKNQLHQSEKESFVLLKQFYKQYKSESDVSNNSEFEDQYDNCMGVLNENKDLVLDQLDVCLNSLSKVRNLQNNYLASVINNLQAQLNETQGNSATNVKSGSKSSDKRNNNLG